MDFLKGFAEGVIAIALIFIAFELNAMIDVLELSDRCDSQWVALDND